MAQWRAMNAQQGAAHARRGQSVQAAGQASGATGQSAVRGTVMLLMLFETTCEGRRHAGLADQTLASFSK
jgi:hypothetical protein